MEKNTKNKKLFISDNMVLVWKCEGETHALRIRQDEEPLNPREESNIASFWCSHRRYCLGDFDHKTDLEDWITGLLGSVPEAELAAYIRDTFHDTGTDHELVSGLLDEIKYEDTKKGMSVLKHFAVVLPLWLYDHSGITISASERVYPYNDQWDSGQVGYAAVLKYTVMKETREIVLDEEGNPIKVWHGNTYSYESRPYTEETWRKGATECIMQEVKTYDQYLRGDVWWYETFICPDGCDEDMDDWEEEDSCGGFFGDDLMENGILDYAPGLQEAIEAGEYQTGVAEEVRSVSYVFRKKA